MFPEENRGQQFDVASSLQFMKLEDSSLVEKQIEREIMKLVLKTKKGTFTEKESALRQLIDQAREFGAEPLFNQILPLVYPERHKLVILNRVIYELDVLAIRPYVHKILFGIKSLLMAKNNDNRVEAMEVVYNLSKKAGLETMIAVLRPDIDDIDEYVREATARAFSVVASAFGIPALLPFFKEVCQNKRSWQGRHTGIMVVQQIAILIGDDVLPHLRYLVETIEHGFNDVNQKIRITTALAVAALAEAAAPYGIETFHSVLKPLCKGVRSHRGKTSAAYLKAIGFIIRLMDAVHANYYTKEVMVYLNRDLQSPDEEMKKIVLQVVNQCLSTKGVQADSDILPELFKKLALE